MKKNRFYFIIYLLTAVSFMHSQVVDHDMAHRRYWYYRTRMINDFLKIGTSQGDCIVFPQRNLGFDGLIPEYRSKVGPDQIDITNQYIMALALEYKLLSRGNQDASETIKEIYHLLYTINRLDMEAEQYEDVGVHTEVAQPSGLQTLNGFMLREDMPSNYLTTNIYHYNYSLLENGISATSAAATNYGGFTGIIHTNVLSTDNKFSNSFTGQQLPSEKYLPHDKYHTMLIALMFIDKYIPQSVTYNNQQFQDNISSIRDEARNIANRIYNYCKGQNGTWILKYLNSQNNITGTLSGANGGDAWLYAWPLSKMSCMVNNSFPWSLFNNGFCSNYIDPVAVSSQALYNTEVLTPNCWANDNACFKAWDQGGSNEGVGGLPIWLLMQPNCNINNMEWSELLRKVLHQNGVLNEDLTIYANPINTAPCQGPYNFGSCTNGGFEWSSQDRLEHPDSRNAGCNPSPIASFPCTPNQVNAGAVEGNYPGVDYMLLHNLFYEYQNQLFEGNNGNVSGNGFSFLGNGFSNVATWILNSGSNVSNSVGTTICNIANTFNGWFGGGNVCSGNNNSGNGGSGSAYSPVPYIAYNLMDNIDNNVWPRNVFTGFSAIPPHNATYQVQGTNTIPSKVAVYQNLSSNAHIYATSSPAALNNNISSNVAYRAGKEITLTDGFQVDAGSSFHAYVSRYLCNGNNGEALNLRQNANSGLMVDLNHYETDTVNQIPIHYVEYPKSDSDIYPVVNESSYQTNPVSKDELQNNLVSAYSEASEVGDKPALSLLETEASKQRFVILPNPNNGVFKIFANKVAATEEFTIVIYDMKGLEVTRYDNLKDNVSLDVDFTQLSRGIYMINISSTLGYKNSKKVSIN